MTKEFMSEEEFMRLYNTYYVCKACLPAINELELTEFKQDNVVKGYRTSGWKIFMEALDSLYFVPAVFEQVKDTLSVLRPDDKYGVNPELTVKIGTELKEALTRLKGSIESVIKLYESMGIEESKVGIDIKIPKCESLREYMEYLKDVDFILTQCPYLLSDEEVIKFKNVDVGSQWLTFAVVTSGTFAVLSNLAKLVDKALAIKSSVLVLKMQEKQLESIELKRTVTEETVGVFKEMKRVMMDGYVSDLEAELGELKDGEERGKVEKSLEKLSLLLEKGVEIYSSIETPDNVKVLFPKTENNPMIPEKILKLIEEKGLPSGTSQDTV